MVQVHVIHELAWAGTPHEGAAWLRAQKLVDIWHRILLIPVVGGVVVGMFHTVIEIVDMIRAAQPLPQRTRGSRIDWLAGIKPFIKALQAALGYLSDRKVPVLILALRGLMVSQVS